jgi:hypothetical protein
MSTALQQLSVTIFILGGGPVTKRGLILISLVVGTIFLVAICWGAVEDWIERTRGRNWPTVSAVIEIVSVAFIQDPTPRYALDTSHYKATLTYVYQYFKDQTGDYSRDFAKKEDAEAWANSYKRETVKVHVDPRDPTRSVLRDEDV